MNSAVALRPSGFSASQIRINTKHAREFVDLTDQINGQVAASGIQDGIALVSSQHTTASIIVNEHEPELFKDLDALLARLVPEDKPYAHNAVPCGPNEHPNGHSHCQGLLLNASAQVPVSDGHLRLGRYQRVFLVELDRARPRTVTVVLMGTVTP